MPDDLQRIIFEIADLKRRVGQMMRVGSIHEVKAEGGEQKVRVNIGKDAKGEPVLSPWLHSGDHRGAAREEFKYKKGQNVMVVSPDGDFRQANVVPWAEATQSQDGDFKRPDHASDDAETYQFDELRVTKKADGYDVALGKGDDAMKVRLKKDGSVTGRVDKDIRFAAHKDGAKIKATKHHYFVATREKLIMSEDPEIGEDPVPDDDD